MAVMAELLFRKCNVAVPIIDLGTDTFAFRDDREEVARVQVPPWFRVYQTRPSSVPA